MASPTIRKAAVIGAGVMGGGIAALFARKGFRVRLKDIHPAALQAGLAQVHEVYSERLRRGRMTKNEMQNSMAAITCTTGIAGLGGVEVVVEAVVEDLAVKKAVLREIEAVIPPTVLFASNTSSLSIGALQAEALHPERLAGLHFFNPVEKMPLVEVVRGARTSETALEAAESLARELGKVPVRVADGPGFLVNRLLAPYLNEAVRLLEEGYSLLAIDRALVDFGMPMGPFALLDEIGLDVAAKVGRILEEALGERLRPPALIGRLQDLGARGKKNGKGFYVHGNGRKTPNPAVLRLGGTGGSDFKHDEAQAWLERLLFPMINEAALALEAGIVERPALVDLAMVMGTGFPPFRGGPLRFAEALGLDRVLARLQALAQAGVWKSSPAPLLARLVAERRGFYPREEGSEAHGETAPQADAVGARA
jgi:3-hydroxyacyl-CoA dehydrogenase/enoyl-CoA hydratase/3-hydroxybutyryl-CoA epimerase